MENEKDNISMLQEPREAYKINNYTYEEAEAIFGDKRYELIYGEIFLFASPKEIHQDILGKISRVFGNFFEQKKCKSYIAPFDVFLDGKEKEDREIVVQPDIMIVCDMEKIKSDGIYGVPTLVVEILSSNVTHDRIRKYKIYEKYGVKEYWIVDPVTRITDIFVLNEKNKYELKQQYSFDENIKSYIFENLQVNLKEYYNEDYEIKKENKNISMLQEPREAYRINNYTYEEAEAIFGDKRYELIYGEIFLFASPKEIHQDILGEISFEFKRFLKGKKCKSYVEPFDVFLDGEEKENTSVVVQPDIMIVCDMEKIKSDGIYGAPTLVVEILSSNVTHDRIRKYKIYEKYGVKEYWIVDPVTRITDIFVLNEKNKYELKQQYSFGENIKSHIFENLEVSLKDI
ncbi:MAG: Uma2 family endonuclease [Clostridiales bacterium]|nr:Uma2 family endonuclease [Clostridiales bacterium]